MQTRCPIESVVTRQAPLVKGHSASAVQRRRHTGSPLLSRTQALLAGHSEEAAPVGVVQREVQKSAVRPDGAVVDRQS